MAPDLANLRQPLGSRDANIAPRWVSSHRRILARVSANGEAFAHT